MNLREVELTHKNKGCSRERVYKLAQGGGKLKEKSYPNRSAGFRGYERQDKTAGEVVVRAFKRTGNERF